MYESQIIMDHRYGFSSVMHLHTLSVIKILSLFLLLA
jgi:hypothetical protein